MQGTWGIEHLPPSPPRPAVHMLSLFLGRAVVDEALPPSFLASVLPALPAGGLGVVVVQSTGVLLSSRHAAERLQNCWHGGALTLDEIKAQIKAALDEFLVGGRAGAGYTVACVAGPHMMQLTAEAAHWLHVLA